jgi:hypothetical protein
MDWLQSSQSMTLEYIPGSLSPSDMMMGMNITNDIITPNLLLTAENLICIIHNMIVLTITTAEITNSPLGAWKQDLENVLEHSEWYPTHSFIRQVSRWISDKIESMESARLLMNY